MGGERRVGWEVKGGVEREEGVGEEVRQQMHKGKIGARYARMREGVPHCPQQDGPTIWSIPPEEELISHRCWDRGISCLASACTHNLETNSSCNYILHRQNEYCPQCATAFPDSSLCPSIDSNNTAAALGSPFWPFSLPSSPPVSPRPLPPTSLSCHHEKEERATILAESECARTHARPPACRTRAHTTHTHAHAHAHTHTHMHTW